MLTIPQIRTKLFGSRQFSHATATLGKQIPYELITCKTLSGFKSSLKSPNDELMLIAFFTFCHFVFKYAIHMF